MRMTNLFLALATILSIITPGAPAAAGETLIHHQVTARLDPESHGIAASDLVTIPSGRLGTELHFLLTGDLAASSATPGVNIILEENGAGTGDVGLDREEFGPSSSITRKRYAVVFETPPAGEAQFQIDLQGTINYPITSPEEEYSRGFSQTPGIIESRGAFLAGSTWWIPAFGEELFTFQLTTDLPQGWDSVSQGTRTRHETVEGRRITTWDCPDPMEEVYLVAAPFTEYGVDAGKVRVLAFLRTPDENLANKYLETTAQYLEMYRQLIGPFPFTKFALVENFWPTGYGMPSFTLLGEQIIRFPFILHSSYPHELLHNWWGNSVYVGSEGGNWCEGLTAYLADHLIKEQRGQGDDYRRSTLQSYTDYVNSGNDFPLSGFTSRHDASSQAVGYGKCLMLCEMLRVKIGDEAFVRGLQTFYRDNRWKQASFNDLRLAFEAAGGLELGDFFKQWVERPGAPSLKLTGAVVVKDGDAYRLSFTLEQTQEDEPFRLQVAVAVSFGDRIEQRVVNLDTRSEDCEYLFEDEPLLVQVDPAFNVFRTLHHNEIPPSLSRIFGAEQTLILLPSGAAPEQLSRYRQLAEAWCGDEENSPVLRLDSEVDRLPADRAVWVFGEENIHRQLVLDGIAAYDTEVGGSEIRFAKTVLPREDVSFVIAARHPENPSAAVAWLTIGNDEAGPGLSRKLPHYGKYSYLAFEGAEPANVAKGQWPAVDSPLRAVLVADGTPLPEDLPVSLPPRPALATLDPLFSAERMTATIELLSGDEMEGRGLGSAGIDKAAGIIAAGFEEAGLRPAGDGGDWFQVWDEVVDGDGTVSPVKNVLGLIPGTNPDLEGQSVVLCAHYDHLGFGWPDVHGGDEGRLHPGADDNASGVAVLLELAKMLGQSLKPSRTVIFAAFTAEESGLKGSQHYVKTMKRYPASKVIGAINLDTVGRLGGRKLLVLNSASAAEWKHIFIGCGYVTGVEAEMVTQDLDASDQKSFIEAGVPAVQIFSGPHGDYHRPTDSPDKIDGAGLVKVASFVREALLYLAEREEPLSFAGKKEETPGVGPAGPAKPAGSRRATTGSMPDFSFAGEGVRIGAVSPGSPAETAGLLTGDIIVRIGDTPVASLKEYSDALKTHQPGDTVQLVYVREGEQKTVLITLDER
jgi:hypothetical protein